MAVSEVLLRSCALFQAVSAPSLAYAASMMELVQLKKREVLATKPHAAFRGLGVVVSGRLQAVDYTIDGREAALATVEQGQAFGQANLLAQRPVDLTWVAVAASTVAVMPAQHAQALLVHADISHQFARDLAQQVCDFVGWQKILSVHPVSARVCAWLVWETSGRRQLEIPKHAELAWRLNTTRESITRTLQKLQSDGVVRREGELWVIEDAMTLVELAQGNLRGSE